MAKVKTSFRAIHTAFIKRLKELGCVFCPTCYAYLLPHNHEETK